MFCNVFSSFYYFLDFQWVPGIGKGNIISLSVTVLFLLLLYCYC